MKTALITGASEGIGRSFSQRAAREGYAVIAVARNRPRLETLIDALDGSGHILIVADLSTAEGQAIVKARIESGGIDLLINNAGYGKLGAFTDTPPEEWRRMIELNVWTVLDFSHAFFRQAKPGAALINLSSTLAFLPMPIQGVYSATKSFVTAFTEALWFEGRKRGIRVLNLCPGITATEFGKRSGAKPGELPEFLTQTAADVVEGAWRALEKNRGPTRISGWKNQIGALFARLLSRRALTILMGNARA